MANGNVIIFNNSGTCFTSESNGIHTSNAGVKRAKPVWDNNWCVASQNAIDWSTGETKTLQYVKWKNSIVNSFWFYFFYHILFWLGLALASLLPVQDDIIYQRFDVIIQCICETLNDIMKEDIEYNEDGNESNGLVE